MDQDIFEQMRQDTHPSHAREFARPIIAAAIGGYIGHKLDQTRFGIWFNNNRVVNWVYVTIAQLGVSTVIAGVLNIAWYLFTH